MKNEDWEVDHEACGGMGLTGPNPTTSLLNYSPKSKLENLWAFTMKSPQLSIYLP